MDDDAQAVQDAKEKVDDIFNDTSVSPEETAMRLKAVREHIDMNLDALRSDGVDC